MCYPFPKGGTAFSKVYDDVVHCAVCDVHKLAIRRCMQASQHVSLTNRNAYLPQLVHSNITRGVPLVVDLFKKSAIVVELATSHERKTCYVSLERALLHRVRRTVREKKHNAFLSGIARPVRSGPFFIEKCFEIAPLFFKKLPIEKYERRGLSPLRTAPSSYFLSNNSLNPQKNAKR